MRRHDDIIILLDKQLNVVKLSNTKRKPFFVLLKTSLLLRINFNYEVHGYFL